MSYEVKEKDGRIILIEKFANGKYYFMAEIDSQGWFRTINNSRISQEQINSMYDLKEL